MSKNNLCNVNCKCTGGHILHKIKQKKLLTYMPHLLYLSDKWEAQQRKVSGCVQFKILQEKCKILKWKIALPLWKNYTNWKKMEVERNAPCQLSLEDFGGIISWKAKPVSPVEQWNKRTDKENYDQYRAPIPQKICHGLSLSRK